MPLPWLDLLDDEHIIWRDNPSKWMLFPTITSGIILTGVYLYLLVQGFIPGDLFRQALYTVVLIPLFFVPVGLTELKRRNIEYVVTNKRVAKKTRIIGRAGDPINANKIQNTEYEQSAFDRILSIGSVEVMTSGRGDVDMRWTKVRHPKSVQDIVSEQKDENI